MTTEILMTYCKSSRNCEKVYSGDEQEHKPQTREYWTRSKMSNDIPLTIIYDVSGEGGWWCILHLDNKVWFTDNGQKTEQIFSSWTSLIK